MGKPIIDHLKLDRMLRAGKSPAEIAKHFKVTPGAVSLARRKLKNTVVRTVALEKAHEVVESHLDMMGQLRRINVAINEELDRAKKELEVSEGRDVKTQQDIIIRLSAEIRKQLELQLSIAEVWYDQKVFGEFQAEVLNLLDEMAPGARNEIIKKLKERRFLRGLVAIN